MDTNISYSVVLLLAFLIPTHYSLGARYSPTSSNSFIAALSGVALKRLFRWISFHLCLNNRGSAGLGKVSDSGYSWMALDSASWCMLNRHQKHSERWCKVSHGKATRAVF